MDQTDYILRSLSKVSKKRWEHYVINRIFHRLDDPEIEFICQQCIRRDSDRYYLADLFFPQLGIYLEVQEPFHEAEQKKIDDARRRFDIAEAAGLEDDEIRVSGETLGSINAQIDRFTDRVRRKKAKAVEEGRFEKWNHEHRFTALPHLEKGSVEIGPHSEFRRHRDALNCFGYGKGNYQRGVWNLPEHVRDAIGLSGKCVVWFPKLYEQADWRNALSDDGLVITEENKNPQHSYSEPWDQRIVMAHSRDELNRTLYRFVGVFEVIPEYREGNRHLFRRIATRVGTYWPENMRPQ